MKENESFGDVVTAPKVVDAFYRNRAILSPSLASLVCRCQVASYYSGMLSSRERLRVEHLLTWDRQAQAVSKECLGFERWHKSREGQASLERIKDRAWAAIFQAIGLMLDHPH